MTGINSTVFKNKLLLPILVVLLGSCFTFVFLGFYYSEYEGLNIALLSGSLTPGMPFRSLYFSGNQVISWFYSLFYEYLPGVEWISWFETLWMLIAAVLAMVIMNITMPQKFPAWVKMVLMLAVFMLVFAEHQVHLIYTRVAYLVCGFSLISMVVFFEDFAAIKRRWWLFLLLNLFFAMGTLIRNESAIACFLLMLPFAFIYQNRIQHVAVLFLFPLLMVGGQSLFFALDIKNATNTEFYKQVEPDIEEQFIARKNIVPFSSMKTHRDSVIYQMAQEMTFSDPRILTPTFLRSLILPESFIFTDIRQWKRVVSELWQILSQYWYLVLMVLLLSWVLYLQYNFNRHPFAWLRFAIFVLSFWGLTIAQTYVDKVNERSWVPYIGLFIFCHIVLLAKSKHTRPIRYPSAIAAMFLMLLVVNVYCLGVESKRLAADVAFQQQQLRDVESVAKGRILVINSSAFNFLFLSNRPFHPFNFSAFKKVYITDSYILPFLPYYKRYIESECKCNVYDYPSIWKYLSSIKEDVVVVSQPYRLNMVREYVSTIYQLQLPLIKRELLQLNIPKEQYNKEFIEGIELYTFGD